MLDLTRAYGMTFLVPAADTTVGFNLRAYGEFARPEVDLLDAYVSHMGADRGFLDVGANIGAVGLPVASRHPTLRTVAIEAHRGLSGVLVANVLNNQLYGVEVLNAAAGAEPGLIDFPSCSLDTRINFGELAVGLAGPKEQVRVVTLDQVAPAHTGVVEIDVEGYEIEVLKGADRLLSEVKPVWLLEAKRQDLAVARAVAQRLSGAGYRLFLFFAPFVTPSAAKGFAGKANRTGDFNFLALPDGAPNLWNLPEVGPDLSNWSTDMADYGYLRRYGFQ